MVGLQDYKEADRIVRLLTPENGRITALARSARSSSKRFGGTLDIGNRIEVTLRPPKGVGGWWSTDLAAPRGQGGQSDPWASPGARRTPRSRPRGSFCGA